MMLLESIVRSELAKALGWTLVHSLWEGAAIALALAISFGIARSARVRYAAACLAMLALLAGFAATLYRFMPNEINRPAVRMLPQLVSPSASERPVVNARAPWDASELLPWLAPVWLAGVLLFQLRYLVSWTAAGRLRRIGVCTAPEAWIERLDGLRARLRMTKSVTLLESCFAEVPVVIGHLRPVILMPVGLLAGLPAGQVEAILLHELAHIRRADYLVNLMQTLLEGLLFYHPAAWWISSAIRKEREHCCDDLVVLTSGNAHEYATALAALAGNGWTVRQGALAATGGNLVKRIQRMLSQPEAPRNVFAPILPVGILVVTGAVGLGAWQAPTVSLPFVRLAQAQTAPAEHAAASKYDRWLTEEVVYIITDRERAEFKKLGTDEERDHFIEQFWERRDPTPGTPKNEYRDEHYRRIAYVNDRFTTHSGLPGWKMDRGRIYIQYGPPDEIDSHPSGGSYTRPPEEGGAQTVTYPFEQWRYRFIEGIGNNVILEFVDKEKTGDYRLTMDPAQKEVPAPPIKREQAERAEKLREAERRLASAHTEQVQQQLRALAEQLRAAEKQTESVPEQKLLQWQQVLQDAKLAQAERGVQTAAAQLKLLLQKYNEDFPEVVGTRRQLTEATLLRDELLKNEEATFGQQENSVFLSGSGSQAAVVILPDRSILVTIPFEFSARQYLVSISAVSSDGKTSWSNTNRQVTSNNGSLTVGLALPAGSYTLKAVVKDSASSTEKTYVVNFSVK
jgi:GWxTD domain-containing protein